LLAIRFKNLFLEIIPELSIYRMSKILMLLWPSLLIFLFHIFYFCSALSAKFVCHRIFKVTFGTWLLHLSTGHCDKKAIFPFDNPNFTDYKRIVKSHRRICAQSAIWLINWRNSGFSNFHVVPPFAGKCKNFQVYSNASAGLSPVFCPEEAGPFFLKHRCLLLSRSEQNVFRSMLQDV